MGPVMHQLQRQNDAVSIWKAAVDAVRSDKLVEQNVECSGDRLTVCGHGFSLSEIRRIEVVGCGKAGAGMARAISRGLEPATQQCEVAGWVNVPADCVEHVPWITLHAARPAGINEPTIEGVEGTKEILSRVQSLGPSDLCIVLISGGGSALLPAPVPEISLADKLALTRYLARKGAPIEDLNTVRSQISLVKGGGLLRRCAAGKTIALIISDVIGDPLDVIASGPTALTNKRPEDALAVLKEYDPTQESVPASVSSYLLNATSSAAPTPCPVENHVIGSNQIALTAAAAEATQRGYQVVDLGSQNSGKAAEFGRRLFAELRTLRARSESPVCLLAGGETTVHLADTKTPRRGGRNQEVVLAAVAANYSEEAWQDLVLLSAGTDGEDGPTDAAGAIADRNLLTESISHSLKPAEFLSINNSYEYFERVNGLIKTGPTNTNVMDVAVGLVFR